MYERFTDRARRVFQLANQEALRFNHEYIGTEHVLLGLLKEGNGSHSQGTGVAAQVLRNLKVDLRVLRLEIEKLTQPGSEIFAGMAKLPHTPRTKKVVELAMSAARERGDNHVGTEHLLIGLILEGEGVAYTVLANMGIAEKALEEVHILLGLLDSPPGLGILPETPIHGLEIMKEQAVVNQDFEAAKALRQEIQDLKSQAASTKYDVALWKISSILVSWPVHDQSPKEMFMAIAKIVKETENT